MKQHPIVSTLAVLLALYPWNQLAEGGSPFVLIFSALGSDLTANILNVVVLTAALSVYNSCVYCNSRMLHGLAQQGNAPRFLMKVDKRGVPVVAIALSGLMTLVCVVINYLIPGKAFQLLMALVVAALVINWAMISLTHIKFRHAMNAQQLVPAFKAFWFPFANYLCLVFMAAMLVILYLLDEKISVYLVPVWLVLLWAGYQYKRYVGKQQRPLGGVAKVVAE